MDDVELEFSLESDELARFYGLSDEQLVNGFDLEHYELATSSGKAQGTLRLVLEKAQKEDPASVVQFWAKFTQTYANTLMNSYYTLLDSKPANMNSALIDKITVTPQYSRYIREHPEGQLVLPTLIRKFSAMCPRADDLPFLAKDPESYGKTEWLSQQIFGITSTLFFLLHLSPPSVAVASFDAPSQSASELLASQLTWIISIVPRILTQHKQFLATAQNQTVVTLKWGLERALSHSKGILPFLTGEITIEGMRDRQGYVPVCWWDCEVTRVESLKGSRACSRKALQACSRCHAVTYCSPLHQKQHWKAHKLECRKPTW